MFGKKKYSYQLQLESPVPNTIYKERNINISVSLKNKKKEIVLNCSSALIQPTSSTCVWECATARESG